jgi:hypothetical protein
VSQLIFTGLRRSGLGIETAAGSRYAYVVLALLLPLVILAFDRVVPSGRQLFVGAATLAAILFVQLPILRDEAGRWSGIAQAERRVFIAAVQLKRSGEVILDTTPVPWYSPDVQVDELVGHTDVLTARTFLQLRGRPAAVTPGGPDAFELVATSGTRPDPGVTTGDCLTLVPTSPDPVVRLHAMRGGSVAVTTERDGALQALFVEPGTDITAERPRSFPLQAGVPEVLDVSAEGIDLQLVLPGQGTTKLCGITPAAR